MQGCSSSQIFGGAKKIAKKGSIFFPIWAKNYFELSKKKIWWRHPKKFGGDAQINT
jgi:hypothetical protein